MRDRAANVMPRRHQRIVLIACAITGWVLCGAVMGVGLSLTTLDNALVVHAVAAPLIFGVLAALYFRAFPGASVPWTASIWLSIVMLLDLCVVASLIERSLAMFQSPLGTWVPFALIWLSTFAVGERMRRDRRAHPQSTECDECEGSEHDRLRHIEPEVKIRTR